MRKSVLKLFVALVLFVMPALFVSAVSAQVPNATCTFSFFKPPGLVNGVNDYGTIVGVLQTDNSKAYVRYPDGTVSYFHVPNSQITVFMARNDAGVTVGKYSLPSQVTPAPGSGLILNGSKFTSVNYPNAVDTALTGINKYNTTVGVAGDANYQSHAFKRYSNGSLVNLQYPGATSTQPRAINDNGTIVGSANGPGFWHGFIYHAGTWAKVDFPNAPYGTQLYGISAKNVIVGQDDNSVPPKSYMYANGVFKRIMAPNSYETEVYSISENGLMTGIAFFKNSSYAKGFLATCH